MALRTGHGTGAGQPRIEILPPDELPLGVQAEPHAEAGDERRPNGTWQKGSTTAQRAGGLARKHQTALASQLGLAKLVDATDFGPYRRAADNFAKAQRSYLARTVGGGECGPAPSSMVASAALQLAASRYLSDRAAADGDPSLFVQASKLANDSRQNLAAAHEYCARTAKAAAKSNPSTGLLDALATTGSGKGAP